MTDRHRTTPAPIILVPGFWLGAWAWDEVAEDLRAEDHDVSVQRLSGDDRAGRVRITLDSEQGELTNDATAAAVRKPALDRTKLLLIDPSAAVTDNGESPAMTFADLSLDPVTREVTRGTRPVPLPRSQKTRALLAYLAATGREHRRETLCSLFWNVPDDPKGALRWSLSRLRQVVDEPGRTRIAASDSAMAPWMARLRCREMEPSSDARIWSWEKEKS